MSYDPYYIKLNNSKTIQKNLYVDFNQFKNNKYQIYSKKVIII